MSKAMIWDKREVQMNSFRSRPILGSEIKEKVYTSIKL